MKFNPKSHLARLILSTIAAPAALVFTASQVDAVTNYQGAADDWTVTTNWSGGVVPTGAFNQRLNFNGGTTVTFSAAQGTVDVGAASGESRSIVLSNVNPNASTGTATLNITGGVLQAGTLAATSSLVGANGVNSVGILNVSGTGILDLTTATATAGRVLSLGLGATANTGISGTVTLSGTGLIKVGEFRIGDTVPNTGGSITGVLHLNGGTLETGALREGTASALVSSTVNLNGGLLKITAATGISATLDTVNVLSGGAKIEVITGVISATAEALLDGGGGGGLTKTGVGSLALSGNNTYTGPTKINGGTLRFATQGSLYNNVSANWTAANINALSGTTLAVFGDSAGTAGFTSTNLDTLLANISVANSATEGLQAGAFLGIDTNTATGASFTQGNAIADSTGANGGAIGLTKLGGGALVLDKSNTYTGATTISGGVIVVTANNALGTTASGTTVAPATSLALSGGIDYSTTESITGSGLGSAIIAGTIPATSRGLIQSVSGNNIFRGNIVVDAGSNTRFGTQDGASLTLTGTITQATGDILFRAGNGPLLPTPNTGGDFITLSNSGNSFGGNSTIFTNALTGYSGVRLGVADALPTSLTISGLSGSTPTAAGTALDLNGFAQTLNGLISTIVLNIINTNTGTPSTLTLNPTADKITAGTVILGGTGLTGALGTINVVKEGTFSQTLAGVNTYSGTTTINAGTLVITGATLGTSAITFGGGALGLDITTPVTAASAAVNLAGGSVLVTGMPTLASYTLLTASSITGTPTLAVPVPGYALQVSGGNQLQLVQAAGSPYDTWAGEKGLTGANNAKTDDPDKDGRNNIGEFAFNGDPLSGSDNGKVYVLTEDTTLDGDTLKELILTVAVRTSTPAFSGSPSPTAVHPTDAITYSIEGSLDLNGFPSSVTVLPAAVTTDLPGAGTGYEYRSFSLDGSNGLPGKGFLRAKVTSP